MRTDERTLVIPSAVVFDAVDSLLDIAPESVHVIPELLVDEIVRSAFYPLRYGVTRPDVWPGVIVMGYQSVVSETYVELLGDIVYEAARVWGTDLQYIGANSGHLVDYAMHRGARVIVLRVRDYGR